MRSIRFRLDPPVLTGLAARVRDEYGPDARIVDTEERVEGGIGGFFGRRVIDVVVEVPEKKVHEGSHEFDGDVRAGLAALLDDADAHDLVPARTGSVPRQQPADRKAVPTITAATVLPARTPAAEPAVSTQSTEFASMLDGLRLGVRTPAEADPRHLTGLGVQPYAPTRPSAPAPVVPVRFPDPLRSEAYTVAQPPAVVPRHDTTTVATVVADPGPPARSRTAHTAPGALPPLRTGPGDLLLLVGLGDDAAAVAESLRERLQTGHVCDGGGVSGHATHRVDDERGALAARAKGVRTEQPVIVAFGLGEVGNAHIDAVADIEADQVWAVVDGASTPEAALRWIGPLRRRVQVDAAASVRVPAESALATYEWLGLPEAWTDRPHG